jgi:hypothetical protein
MVYKNVRFSEIKVVTADKMILVSINPIRNYPGSAIGKSYMGRFRLRTWW